MKSCMRPKSLTYSTFEDPRDAEDAMYNLDRTRFYGRELEIEFARGDRKSECRMSFHDCADTLPLLQVRVLLI